MPRKPGSLRARLAAARERHRERHRPSGFGFALADSIDYLDAATWDAVSAGQSLFLQRRYLGALERAGPDNLARRYALIFRGRQPVAGVVMQIVTVAGTRLMKPLAAATGRGGLRSARALLSRALSPVVRRAGEAVRERVLVCGNLLSWGFHAVAFARDEDPAAIWPVVENAPVRPVTLPVAFFPTLAESLGDDFRATLVRRESQPVGFISVLRDGDTAVAYYIGFERTPGVGNTVYLALLHSVIGDAIEMRCRRVSFGRTALEPKAGLGARPERLWLWARHRNPALNVLIRRLLRAVPHGEAPERNPFKSAPRGE